MQLEHSFTVPVGVDDAWAVLLDIERIAPCMPGAAIDSVDGDDFTGTVKVKLGPISLTYKGKASFIEKDVTAHRAVINAQGRDSRGDGHSGGEGHRDPDRGRRLDERPGHDRSGHHRQAGPVRPWRHGRRRQQADRSVRRLPRRQARRRGRTGCAGRCSRDRTDRDRTDRHRHGRHGTGQEGSGQEGSGQEGRCEEGRTRRRCRHTRRRTASASASASASAQRSAPREVEPIDLLESAGPAVAKRLAPVIGGVLLLLIIIRLLRRR